MKYNITRDYIDLGNSRSGESLGDVQFIVSHDTGNPGSTAYANRNYFANVNPTASAHTFIDDNYILEIIPLSEKAWHVRYDVGTDNRLFGADANDAAIGVELAWGGNINFQEAYDRYVWYHAYLIDKYNLDPKEDIVAHSTWILFFFCVPDCLDSQGRVCHGRRSNRRSSFEYLPWFLGAAGGPGFKILGLKQYGGCGR